MYSGVSAATVSKNELFAPPRPWIRITCSGPVPEVRLEMRAPRDADVVDAQQRGAVVGKAEQALESDGAVEVPARPEPALREGVEAGHPPLAEGQPGAGVGADDDVRTPAGRGAHLAAVRVQVDLPAPSDVGEADLDG